MELTDLKEQLAIIKANAEAEITDVLTEVALNHFKSKYLNKKSELYCLRANLKDVDSADRASFGKNITVTINILESMIQSQKDIVFKIKYLNRGEHVPLINRNGYENLLLKTKREVENLFLKLNYEIIEGREIETDEYNFARLNLGIDHPARDMQDTFYINNHLLLRTHCTNMQARMMEQHKNQSIQMVSIGKVYRRDDDDATHSHQFMQIDGFVVSRIDSEKTANLTDLIATLKVLATEMFGSKREIRLRPSFFPFTSPSYEVDMSCNCENGCRICQNTGFIEILGAGMIHQNVFDAAGFDQGEYYGYAFGIGIERIAMLKYGVSDIRDFYHNDLKFLAKDFIKSERGK